MSRLITSGFEIYVGDVPSGIGAADGDSDGLAPLTRATSGQRSGSACLRCSTTTATAANYFQFTGANERGYWARAYVKVGSLPSSNARLLYVTSANGNLGAMLDTSGRVFHANATGTVSAPINDGAWHRIEVFTFFSATQANRQWELRVDGVTISSGSNQATFDATAPTLMYLGWSVTLTADISFDDIALNDDQGAAPHNTWPGDGYVILLVPNADNSIGSWTGGAGGTTNLWQALDNIPPAGAVAPGTNTQQIRANAVATTGKFDTTSYISGGATAGDVAVLCQTVVCHGEEVATGTKTGNASTDTAVNNTPSSATPTFNYGNDLGAEGAWPSLWGWSIGAAGVYTTQPTLTSGARLNVVTTSASRVASCCFLGLYVEMKPSAVPKKSLVVAGRRNSYNQLARWY